MNKVIRQERNDAPSPWKGEDQGGGRVHMYGMLKRYGLYQPIPTQPSPFQGEGFKELRYE